MVVVELLLGEKVLRGMLVPADELVPNRLLLPDGRETVVRVLL